MNKTIDQFMWGFQHYFRWHVAYETERVLKEIGMPVEDVQAFLVGIAMMEDARHVICVEPETGPLRAEHLAQVTSRAKELYQSDPESSLIHSHPQVREARQRDIFHKARANAITEAIEESKMFDHLTFFVSQSSPINGYEVHTCIAIPTSVIGNLPAFKESTVERFHAGQSLPHEVIRECLHRADKALYLPDPGSGSSILGRAEDIVTSSTEGFISGITWRTVREPSDLFGALNAIASLTYERAGAMGSLIVTSHENLGKWLKVRFKKPVRLQESRTMRKVIQLSDSTMSVLADNHYAYGLGLGKTAPDIIEVSITGHAKWEASVNSDKYVRVTYGKATIPSQPIEIEDLEDTAERIIGNTNTKRIWEIVQAAQKSGKGVTIVISKDPEAETERLSSEGMPIDTDYLEPDEIVRLGSVDGAVIIGPDGRCHAFGVILDGVANESGDRARGSRFNSAVRYQKMETAGSMIVVISDDGTIDLLPRLMPRIYRADVESAVDSFCEYCDSKLIDGEVFERLYRNVKRLAFYINDEQCRRVNEKHEQEMERRLASSGSRIMGRNLQLNPEMNESYFWDT